VLNTATAAATMLLVLLLHPFDGLFSRITWLSQYQKSKTSLDLNEARDDGVLECRGISMTIGKQSAPRSGQVITPTPQHTIFTGRMLFLMPSQQCQSTEGIYYILKLYLIMLEIFGWGSQQNEAFRNVFCIKLIIGSSVVW